MAVNGHGPLSSAELFEALKSALHLDGEVKRVDITLLAGEMVTIKIERIAMRADGAVLVQSLSSYELIPKKELNG